MTLFNKVREIPLKITKNEAPFPPTYRQMFEQRLVMKHPQEGGGVIHYTVVRVGEKLFMFHIEDSYASSEVDPDQRIDWDSYNVELLHVDEVHFTKLRDLS